MNEASEPSSPSGPPALVVSPRWREWGEILVALREAGGFDMDVAETAADAQAALADPAFVLVLVDPELPDMFAYDLVGWVRARFRELPVVMLDDASFDTSAVYLEPGGGVWTIPESLRERMRDPSVLQVTPESIPVLDAAVAALALEDPQQGGEQGSEESLAGTLKKMGFATVPEMIFFMRNLPHDAGDRDPSELTVRFEPGPIASA